MIKIGIVGLGRIGQVHIQNIQQRIPDAQIVAACSATEQSLRFAANMGVNLLFTSFKKMLEKVSMDAVIIASPTALHFEHLQLAIAAGKHIFCEKPIDLTLDNVHHIKSLVDKAGIKFMLGFNRRYDPNILKIKQELTDQRLGNIHSLRLISRDPGPPPMDYIKTSGGLFLDMAIHDFDLARHLMESEVSEIYTAATIFGKLPLKSVDDVDTAISVLKFQNGSFATIENSRNSTYGYDQRVEVFGDQGLLATGNKSEDTVYSANSNGFHYPKPLKFFIERYKESYFNILDVFVKSLTQDLEPEVTQRDGLKSLIISLAAKKSQLENRTVSLSEIN
jgi:myo-inositol 2-dehydrogenase/D-chiro-inositol 1-dehydrogenase